MHLLAKVLRWAAMRAMVRSEKRRLPSDRDLFPEIIEEGPGQTARPEGPVITPLFPLHEDQEAAEIAALHRPGALGGRHLHGKVSFQPAGEKLPVPSARSRRTGRRCIPPVPSSGWKNFSPFPHRYSFVFSGTVLELLRTWFLAYCDKTLNERYLLCSDLAMVKLTTISSTFFTTLNGTN